MAISRNTTAPGEFSDLELTCIFHVTAEDILLLKSQGMTSAEIAECQRQRFQEGTLVEPKVTYREVSPEEAFLSRPESAAEAVQSIMAQMSAFADKHGL